MYPTSTHSLDGSANQDALRTPGDAAREGQYSLSKILTIWAAAALPMVFLGWVAAPLVGDRLDLGVGSANNEALTRALFITLGLIWQFALVMFIIRREEGDLRWSTIRRRCWLTTPRDPKTGQPDRKLWWWLVPLIIAVGALQFIPITDAWVGMLPFLEEPARYSFDAMVESDARKDALEGAWHVLGLFVVLGIFNTVIGEELLFRGILLPRMNGVFGKRDWIANGLLFGLYHLHQPWGIAMSIVDGIFLYAWPSKRFRSAWMGIAVHSAQTVVILFLVLGLVLGLA